MCGITGLWNLSTDQPIQEAQLRQMLAMIRHRGPDQFGIYLDDQVGLGNARLSIVDLGSGQQPICNEDGTLWIVFNGEIFNHVELRPILEARGHRFTTHSDTEVLLHLYEEYGPACLHQLNGQFSFAIWDSRRRTLFMARDRLGVRPLFYTIAGGRLIFGSEIKAILADPRVSAEIDRVALDQIFSFWCPVSPRTIFQDIVELPPGHYLIGRDGAIEVRRYWEPRFDVAEAESEDGDRREEDWLEELRDLLVDATRIRLRADVPVGAYLSGGLDSSTIAAAVQRFGGCHLETFSIAFSDSRFDESAFQMEMARALGTTHHVVRATHEDIGRVFPDVVWHAETPMMRTAPAPMFLLSQLVGRRGYKVVLTGEGADEFLGGYDIFKEAKIRRFWARQPQSTWRPALLRKLYPDVAGLSEARGTLLQAFFRAGLTDTRARDYSHAIRWRNNRRTRRFFSEATKAAMSGASPMDLLTYPDAFDTWQPLARDQYLEITLFLSQYLLSTQGDRMAMAHSVEGRYPFLDYRVVAFCNRLPARFKLRGLREKFLLRKLAAPWLPQTIWNRPKRPYRAPIHRSFFNDGTRDYFADLLSPSSIRSTGIFNAAAVGQLVDRIERGMTVSETDDMALAGIVSTELVHRLFVARLNRPPSIGDSDDVKVCSAS